MAEKRKRPSGKGDDIRTPIKEAAMAPRAGFPSNIRPHSHEQAVSESTSDRGAPSTGFTDVKDRSDQKQGPRKTSDPASNKDESRASRPQHPMGPPPKPQDAHSPSKESARGFEKSPVTARSLRTPKPDKERINCLLPSDPPVKHTTDTVRINDIIFYRHTEFCAERPYDIDERDYVEEPNGGFRFSKNRRGLVLYKHRRDVYLSPLTTFSNTPKPRKQMQKMFNEDTGKMEPTLIDYVHVVAADHEDESKDWPGCWGNDSRVYYNKLVGDPGTKVDSFVDLNVVYKLADGEAFQIKGGVIDDESLKLLREAQKEVAEGKSAAQDKALADKNGRKLNPAQQAEADRAARARQNRSRERFYKMKSSFTEDSYEDDLGQTPKSPPPKKRRLEGLADYWEKLEPAILIDTILQPAKSKQEDVAKTEKGSGHNAPATFFDHLNIDPTAAILPTGDLGMEDGEITS